MSFRWGAPELDVSVLVVPLPILRYAKALGLTDAELVFVLQVAAYGGGSIASLAERLGVSPERVRELIRRLEEKGFLQVFVDKRKGGLLGEMVYSFQGLLQKALEMSRSGMVSELAPRPKRGQNKPQVDVPKHYREAIFAAWQKIHLLPDGTDPLTDQDYAMLSQVVKEAYAKKIPLEDVLGTIEGIGKLAEKDPRWKMAKPRAIINHISSYRLGVMNGNGHKKTAREVLYAYDAAYDFRRGSQGT